MRFNRVKTTGRCAGHEANHKIFAAVHESASLIGWLGSSDFQTVHGSGVDVTRGLVLLSGIGT